MRIQYNDDRERRKTKQQNRKTVLKIQLTPEHSGR